ncbi:MAG: RnfABCDGE type electron transport complex subunit D [bacterium]
MRTRTRAFAPHIFSRAGFASHNWQLNLALLLPFLAGLFRFDLTILLFLLLSVAGAIAAEILFSLFASQDFVLEDGWAVSIGLLSALLLPSGAPWWLALLVPVLAVLLGKTLPGGISHSLVHPVVLGLLAAFFLFPGAMTYAWPIPVEGNPLESIRIPAWYENLLSSPGCGAFGATSMVTLVISALLLLLTRTIHGAAMLPFLLASSLSLLFFKAVSPLSQLYAADTLLFAVFILPDTATSPMRGKGRILYGFLAGLFSVPLRLLLGPVVGLLFALPLANIFVPLLDYIFLPDAHPFLRRRPQFIVPSLLQGWRETLQSRRLAATAAALPPAAARLLEEAAPNTETRSTGVSLAEASPGDSEHDIGKAGGKSRPVRQRRPKEIVLPLFYSTEVSELSEIAPVQNCPCGGSHNEEQGAFLEELRRRGWRFFQATRAEQCVGCLQLAPLSSSLAPLAGDDLNYLAFLGAQEGERSVEGLLLAQALVASRSKDGLCAFASPRLGEDLLVGYGFERVAETPNLLMIKRFRPGAEVAYSQEPALQGEDLPGDRGSLPKRSLSQKSSGKLLEAIFTPRCPLLADNFRRALELAAEVDPDLETREYLLHTIDEASTFPGEGLFFNGFPLSHTFLDLERWPDDFRALLQPLVQDEDESAAPLAGGLEHDAPDAPDDPVVPGHDEAEKVSSPPPPGADQEQDISHALPLETSLEGFLPTSAASPDQQTDETAAPLNR